MTIRIGNPKGRHLYNVEVSKDGVICTIEVAETAAKNAGYIVRSVNMIG